jgi:hypothetical protein
VAVGVLWAVAVWLLSFAPRGDPELKELGFFLASGVLIVGPVSAWQRHRRRRRTSGARPTR